LDVNVGRPLYLEIGHFIFACENANCLFD